MSSSMCDSNSAGLQSEDTKKIVSNLHEHAEGELLPVKCCQISGVCRDCCREDEGPNIAELKEDVMPHKQQENCPTDTGLIGKVEIDTETEENRNSDHIEAKEQAAINRKEKQTGHLADYSDDDDVVKTDTVSSERVFLLEKVNTSETLHTESNNQSAADEQSSEEVKGKPISLQCEVCVQEAVTVMNSCEMDFSASVSRDSVEVKSDVKQEETTVETVPLLLQSSQRLSSVSADNEINRKNEKTEADNTIALPVADRIFSSTDSFVSERKKSSSHSSLLQVTKKTAGNGIDHQQEYLSASEADEMKGKEDCVEDKVAEEGNLTVCEKNEEMEQDVDIEQDVPIKCQDHFGTSLEDLPTISADYGKLRQTPNHCFLVDVDDEVIRSPDDSQKSYWKPFPDSFNSKRVKCDERHVQMPYTDSDHWQTVKLSLERLRTQLYTLMQPQLDVVQQNLEYDLAECLIEHMTDAISFYSKVDCSDFQGLHRYLDGKSAEEQSVIATLLRRMVKLALSVQEMCTMSIPLLTKQKDFSVTMSQMQAACLLANAFFWTFPNPKSCHVIPFTFSPFFRASVSSQFAKFDCIFNYFQRVLIDKPAGLITFQRKVLVRDKEPDWKTSPKKIHPLLRVSVPGRIENDAPYMVHADFANKFVGGGVLGEGCVQEEILFVVCPELLVSRLLTEELDKNETLLVTGCERFNDYTGYGWSFHWNGNYQDDTLKDSWHRRLSQVIAMDAMVLHGMDACDQFQDWNFKRELNKAYCGFCESSCIQSSSPASAIATGNWGCGAFGGDPRVKALIQLMAASEADRPLYYFTFGDHYLAEDISEIHKALVTAECSVGQLWQLIEEGVDVHGRTLWAERVYRYITDNADKHLSAREISS